ncbi:hypothetical protein CDAR_283621 [Caerostris darwini]|uniref:Uncharacterized protein n=1 Tax=Caerostris darwini TaxID=1538125 RepID=A0AAV4TT98_9ARAC|nr:hypothetical protein CDAR_283621 [Caerostris darwini]
MFDHQTGFGNIIKDLLKTCISSKVPSERLASPVFSEKLSNLSDEELCARITTVTKKKDITQNLYVAYPAVVTGHSPDDDDGFRR